MNACKKISTGLVYMKLIYGEALHGKELTIYIMMDGLFDCGGLLRNWLMHQHKEDYINKCIRKQLRKLKKRKTLLFCTTALLRMKILYSNTLPIKNTDKRACYFSALLMKEL